MQGVRPPLILAVGALMVVPGLAAWGLLAPGDHARPRGAASMPPISYPSPIVNPLTRTRPPAMGKGWHLVFDPKFSGSTLQTGTWGRCYPWHDVATGCSNFGNAEYEWYMPGQDHVAHGVLHLVATRKSTLGTTQRGAPTTYFCRSGMVTSYPSLRFKYGYVKVVAILPKGAGLWAGIWLAAANLKWPPEIDMVESWGAPKARTGVYFHPGNHQGAKRHLTPADDRALRQGWHTYSLAWDYHRITWFVDGQPIMTVHHLVTHQDMYLIANLADYHHPKQTCRGQLQIRSIQVWQRTRR